MPTQTRKCRSARFRTVEPLDLHADRQCDTEGWVQELPLGPQQLFVYLLPYIPRGLD
jgi:hypothetical protein